VLTRALLVNRRARGRHDEPFSPEHFFQYSVHPEGNIPGSWPGNGALVQSRLEPSPGTNNRTDGWLEGSARILPWSLAWSVEVSAIVLPKDKIYYGCEDEFAYGSSHYYEWTQT
jgi:hypothetical protein